MPSVCTAWRTLPPSPCPPGWKSSMFVEIRASVAAPAALVTRSSVDARSFSTFLCRSAASAASLCASTRVVPSANAATAMAPAGPAKLPSSEANRPTAPAALAGPPPALPTDPNAASIPLVASSALDLDRANPLPSSVMTVEIPVMPADVALMTGRIAPQPTNAVTTAVISPGQCSRTSVKMFSTGSSTRMASRPASIAFLKTPGRSSRIGLQLPMVSRTLLMNSSRSRCPWALLRKSASFLVAPSIPPIRLPPNALPTPEMIRATLPMVRPRDRKPSMPLSIHLSRRPSLSACSMNPANRVVSWASPVIRRGIASLPAADRRSTELISGSMTPLSRRCASSVLPKIRSRKPLLSGVCSVLLIATMLVLIAVAMPDSPFWNTGRSALISA